MYNIKAFKLNDLGNIAPSSVKRDWMEHTYDRHAYNCFPVTLTNSLGWSISFPEEISFVWDGISDSSSEHVKVLSGDKYVSTRRANGTISFNAGLGFKTDNDLSLLCMPTPNMFIRGAQCFTTLITTSFFHGDFPIVWKIVEPMIKITIPANTPVANIIPISLTNLQNSEIQFVNINEMPSTNCDQNTTMKKIKEATDNGGWTNFYRDAVDACGNSLGEHEVKAIRLKVI
ncbi:MAG: hypothetical protein EB150_06775 [Nitrososphaeria archaeon]|jgi:hypothetical protein|nr:hypothetical protein [Nitrososphaeria archaeon]